MNGRFLKDWDGNWTSMQAGDYAWLDSGSNEARVSSGERLLAICCPDGSYCHLSSKVHTITEHEDGTITVSPSILRYPLAGDTGWHGYLERGVWRTC
jgi:hypothetical protein